MYYLQNSKNNVTAIMAIMYNTRENYTVIKVHQNLKMYFFILVFAVRRLSSTVQNTACPDFDI